MRRQKVLGDQARSLTPHRAAPVPASPSVSRSSLLIDRSRPPQTQHGSSASGGVTTAIGLNSLSIGDCKLDLAGNVFVHRPRLRSCSNAIVPSTVTGWIAGAEVLPYWSVTCAVTVARPSPFVKRRVSNGKWRKCCGQSQLTIGDQPSRLRSGSAYSFQQFGDLPSSASACLGAAHVLRLGPLWQRQGQRQKSV